MLRTITRIILTTLLISSPHLSVNTFFFLPNSSSLATYQPLHKSDVRSWPIIMEESKTTTTSKKKRQKSSSSAIIIKSTTKKKMPITTSQSPPSRSTPVVTVQPQIQPPNPSFLDVIPALAILLSRLDSWSGPRFRDSSSNPHPTIATKDLPAEADDIKIKLQKARDQILQLPDIESSIEEQEEKIGELDDKIRAQMEVLERLKGRGISLGDWVIGGTLKEKQIWVDG